jgi:murein DD-endopeptidase MepM/ murein hydrolase activator NlpD
VAKVSQIFGEQLFPERRLLLQSSTGVRHVALSGWLQAMLLAVSLATVGAVAYLCVGFMHLRDTLDSRNADTASMAPATSQPAPQAVTAAVPASTPSVDPVALGEMRNEMAGIRQQLATANQNYTQANANYQQANQQATALTQQNKQLQSQLADSTARVKSALDARDDAERRAKANEQALSSKAGSAEQLTKNLDASRNELQQSEAERTTLQNRIQQLQMDLQAAQSRATQLLQQQLASEPQRGGVPVTTMPVPIPPAASGAAPERKPAAAGVPHAQNNVSSDSSELERLLASTGLDIDRLLHGLGNSSGEGGPYIALNDPRASAAADRQRLDDLKRLAKILPLAAPLNSFQVASDFGPRVDPINHRASFHPGLDLDAPYETTVFSTGAGTVIFTGTMDSYGRVVEIDHGHGIVTRYAHLHRILVAKGQKVGLHTPIGELGSTGRSTGPHLHYEVHVDGIAVDPAKFMQAGKNVVQVSGHQ